MTPLSRRNFLKAGGVLLVSVQLPRLSLAQGTDATLPLDQVDSFIAIAANGTITAACGHVDLGTGIRTALSQIVAEELNVDIHQVTLLLGDTRYTPDQGPTIASSSLQVSAIPLRRAAAEAREFLMQRAAQVLRTDIRQLDCADGAIFVKRKPARRIGYGELLQGQRFELKIDASAPLKAHSEYRVVGHSVPRLDIPAKVTGGLTYVHDMRLPGMLHGRVVRPPYTGADVNAPLGRSRLEVDEQSVARLPGFVRLVVIGDFIGVVAEREEQAIRIARALKVRWKSWSDLPPLGLDDLEKTLREHPKQPRMLQDDAQMDAVLRQVDRPLQRTYVWPYQQHASIGPSCALANPEDGVMKVWSGSQNPHDLRADLITLLGMQPEQVEVIRMEASGCYGRNCADDVSADAALLALAVGRPVRVQLMREQEHGWEPKGSAQLIEVRGGLDKDGNVAAYDFATCYPSNNGINLALLLTSKVDAKPQVTRMGDRTAVPQYAYPHMRVVCNDAAPIVRASWMRGVSALPNVFAHESYIDELAQMAGADPIEFRLRYLHDERAVTLIRALAASAHWQPRASPNPQARQGNLLVGRGFAYARYFHSDFPGFGSAWAAWIVGVEVEPHTGAVRVTDVHVAQDCGQMVNPDGVRHQVHGNVIQATSRALMEYSTFDRSGVTSLEWGSYPILGFPQVPKITALLLDRPGTPPLGAGESTSVPSAAAIANALYDATGVRFTRPPFTPERVRAALQEKQAS
ncbi:xanthine dehydrogenase family protein molybdopterin-binding subunit [Pseudomonas sp. PDM23]|uniref:xanthine dehydrogenase family protein molybdopterin-binding subunit n=1 Tax=unclassified Pseudomonas TaxID=196821 RepID=UPI00178237CA|nr:MULTISPECIES: molybdopterin cofactor-binding domain-containing protein [unclassified Pseudomonas]MBD9578183.1 xanthine dehydrogenase family protein molybdopterin-binding subunit [Pseudomonas sp. PDM23]MBD9673382.1 xanthine dehydrogenase family protein molybdopterin-binding subunit [Pseudomonas sp. PDM21]